MPSSHIQVLLQLKAVLNYMGFEAGPTRLPLVPAPEGAIGIVRLSGTESFAIAQKIFKGKRLESGC